MKPQEVERVMEKLKKEALAWKADTKGTATRFAMSTYVAGAADALAVIDPTFTLSNAALETLQELFDL